MLIFKTLYQDGGIRSGEAVLTASSQDVRGGEQSPHLLLQGLRDAIQYLHARDAPNHGEKNSEGDRVCAELHSLPLFKQHPQTVLHHVLVVGNECGGQAGP